MLYRSSCFTADHFISCLDFASYRFELKASLLSASCLQRRSVYEGLVTSQISRGLESAGPPASAAPSASCPSTGTVSCRPAYLPIHTWNSDRMLLHCHRQTSVAGKLHEQCSMLEEEGFRQPVFRCPAHNIVTKINGINSFNYTHFLMQVSQCTYVGKRNRFLRQIVC